MQQALNRSLLMLLMPSLASMALAGDPPFVVGPPTVSASPASDEGGPAAFDDLTQPEAQSDKFQLVITPYAWLPSFYGTAGVAGLKFDIDDSFLNIVDESDTVFGLMGAVDLRYERFVFQINGTYTTAEFSGEHSTARSGPAGGGVEVAVDGSVEVDTAIFEALGGYRFIEEQFGEAKQNRFALDGFVGGRVTWMQLDAHVTAQASVTLPNGVVLQGGREAGIKDSEEWIEPFIGARTVINFGEHWELIVRGDVGGFGVDNSDFTWQTFAGLGYRWQLDGWSLGLFGGYRALGQDYSNGGFTWDVITHGPIIGLQGSWSF